MPEVVSPGFLDSRGLVDEDWPPVDRINEVRCRGLYSSWSVVSSIAMDYTKANNPCFYLGDRLSLFKFDKVPVPNHMIENDQAVNEDNIYIEARGD